MKDRKCNIIYEDNEVILGKMTHYDDRVIIHTIETIVETNSPEEAEALGEKLIDSGMYDSFLVPSLFEGDIICEA